jgi:hypothetical protein
VVFIQIQPRAVRALLALVAVSHHPLVLID